MKLGLFETGKYFTKFTRCFRQAGALFFFLAVSGCATYHSMPITTEAVRAKLQPPDMAQVRILASEIKHPILHPVELKADGELFPDGAAVLASKAAPTEPKTEKEQ